MQQTDLGTERGPRERRRTARERLLDAAEKLFADQGFVGTTTRSITERAGTSAGAIFYHFESKEGLLVALLRERSPHDRVEDILGRHPAAPRAALSELGVHLATMARAREPMLRLLIRGEEPVAGEVFRRRLSRALDLLSHYLTESTGGSMSSRQARAISQAFLLTVLLSPLLTPTDDPEGFAQDVVDVLLEGWA